MTDKKTIPSRILQIISGSGIVVVFYVVVLFTTISARITNFFIDAIHQNQGSWFNFFLTLFFASILTYFYFSATNLLTLQRWRDETRLIFGSTFSLFGHIGLVGIAIYPIIYGPEARQHNFIVPGLLITLFYSLNLLLTIRFKMKREPES